MRIQAPPFTRAAPLVNLRLPYPRWRERGSAVVAAKLPQISPSALNAREERGGAYAHLERAVRKIVRL